MLCSSHSSERIQVSKSTIIKRKNTKKVGMDQQNISKDIGKLLLSTFTNVQHNTETLQKEDANSPVDWKITD